MTVACIERIEVAEGRLEALVRIPDPRFVRTAEAPRASERAIDVLPGLAGHRCRNERSQRFIDEIADTETPHLLEHIAEELMALAGSPRWLKGETTWDFERDGARVFRVRLDYDDDLVALGALKESVAVIDWVFAEGPRPDVEAMVERLREVRALP
jgi:hypothetical protein